MRCAVSAIFGQHPGRFLRACRLNRRGWRVRLNVSYRISGYRGSSGRTKAFEVGPKRPCEPSHALIVVGVGQDFPTVEKGG